VDKREEHPAGEEPEATAGELARRCGLCQTEIAGEFFTLGGSFVCPGCARGIALRQTGRGELRRALLAGAAAALLCALVWYLLTRATNRPLAELAAVAGIAVGLAVHRGSGRHGGWRYQVAAVLLVYGAFVVRYVPPVFGGIADAIKKEHAAQVGAMPPATATTTTTATTTGLPEAPPQTSVVATLKAYFVFTAIAWGLVLASPFMPGTTGLLPLLSLAIGMALAFHLNRRLRPRGPYTSRG
jgi:hypothetical protein